MECIFSVVGTSFRVQLTGGARAEQPEMELSRDTAAPRTQTGTRGQSSYIAEGRIGLTPSNPGGDAVGKNFSTTTFINFLEAKLGHVRTTNKYPPAE